MLYPSPTEQGWNEWSFANKSHHDAIDAAILSVLGVAVTKYRIWPTSADNFSDFLEQHQQAHTQYNQLLGIDGQDLTGLNLKDKPNTQAWFWSHYVQHQAAAQILGLPTL